MRFYGSGRKAKNIDKNSHFRHTFDFVQTDFIFHLFDIERGQAESEGFADPQIQADEGNRCTNVNFHVRGVSTSTIQ